jgi:hypothetical protein
MERKKIPSGAKVPIKLTIRERDLILDKTFCEPDFAQSAVIEGNDVCINLSLDEIEELQGCVAAEANHTKSSKREKELDEIFDKLQFFLDTYEVAYGNCSDRPAGPSSTQTDRRRKPPRP